MASIDCVIVTCEHASRRVPFRYRALFRGQEAVLKTHRGSDLGALRLARELATALEAPLFAGSVSRLLIDLNRSLHHLKVYSAITRACTENDRRRLAANYYLPYRNAVEQWIAHRARRGRTVLHLSIHSFTPVLDGQVRHADIGLLYDPRRALERTLCGAWRRALCRAAPALTLRLNYPYRGKTDGFTAYLRQRFPSSAYLGVEIEVNQTLVHSGWKRLRQLLRATLKETLCSMLPSPV
ncbi:MAG: N-formylglutamate amidohydrolase [Gammaproteobacteria bacterium]